MDDKPESIKSPSEEASSNDAPTVTDSGLRPELGEGPGTVIGHYKLLQKLGEGGFGVVYMAEQAEPVRRRVALKVIKLGMDTKAVIARFESERQALALMDHPNIAKVFEAGTTESGRPYFVMELIKGIRITDYCDQNNLSMADRLGLILRICQAIQHAHQKGVIHRDIKPSNILVAMRDGAPVPKLIDFGIAKATTDQRLTDKTLVTALQLLIGTPAYMSPEQADMSALDIDTRSDIYSLGVLLYELLTGRTPFDTKRLVDAGLDEIRRIIREEEPPKPSARLSTMAVEEQTTVAKRRDCDPPKLISVLRGDLDWIVMKALEKDRTRRYETADGLASDLLHYLNNEPVEARPPHPAYRLHKMVQRNRMAVAVGAAIAIILVLAVVVSVSLATTARSAERLAHVERLKAKLEGERAYHSAALEKEQRLRAEAAIAEVKESLSGSHFLQACRFIAEDNDRAAVAYLVASLKAKPTNDAALTRLVTMLTYRNWPRLKLSLSHGESGHAAHFSPDGKRVLTVSLKKRQGIPTLGELDTVRVWDAQTGQLLSAPRISGGLFVAARFSPDSKRILTVDMFGTPQVWDGETGQPLNKPTRHSDPVNYAEFSPDGRLIATTRHFDRSARVWDVQTGNLVAELKHADDVRCASFSADSRMIVTGAGSVEGEARVWDARSWQLVTEPLSHKEPVISARFSENGRHIVTGIGVVTGEAVVWDAQSGEALSAHFPHARPVNSACFSPNGTRIVTASDDWTAQVWDAFTGKPLTEPLRHQGAVHGAKFSPDGNRVLTETWYTWGGGDNTARVWDAHKGQPLTEPFKHHGARFAGEFSPDGQRLLTASSDGEAWMWDTRAAPAMPATLKYDGEVESIQFGSFPEGKKVVSPDGRQIVTASRDGIAWVADLQTGRQVTEPLRHAGFVYSANFSQDSKRIATVSGWGNSVLARVWDAQTGQPLSEWLSCDGLHGSVGIQFSPDGKQLIAKSEYDPTARVWDVAPSSTAFPSWLLPLATALCGATLTPQGVLEFTIPVTDLDEIRRTMGSEATNGDWLTLGQWLLADPAARTIAPFSAARRAE